jgi:hypothetical protein
LITPGSELFIIRIPTVKDNDAVRWETEFIGDYVFCNSRFVCFAVGDMSEGWKIAIVVEKQMQFHSSFGATELCPIKKAQAEINHRGIHTEELILESNCSLSLNAGLSVR